MSAVETVRDIPLIVEARGGSRCIPMDIDDETGFPFDRENRESDRDGSFRTQLDDIAKRHPEIAEHLQSFPLRSGRRQNSADDPEFFRRFERPFGARLDRFGFPFDRDEFDNEPQTHGRHPDFQQEFYQPQPGYYQPQQSGYYQQAPQQEHQSATQPQPEQKKEEESHGEGCGQCSCGHSNKPPEPDRGRARNIQQSNTVDLGQKQEQVNDREPRSMSAPPDNRQQRFMSSINIPIQRDGNTEDGNTAKHYTSHPQQNQQSTMTGERVIPIHVEGRDAPVMPKNLHTQPERPFAAQPQPEKIFGQRPEQFTQFVREPKQFPTDWQQHHAPPQQQHHAPPQQQQQHHAPPQQQQQREKSPQPASKPSQAPTPIEQIQSIQQDVSKLMKEVDEFTGVPKDKQYMYLDEMLTRNLLRLDNIDTGGQEGIRNARKEAIRCINECIGVLETKAMTNATPEEAKPQIEEEKKEDIVEETKPEEMEAEIVTETPKVEDVGMEDVKIEEEEKKNEDEEVKKTEEEEEATSASVSELVAKIEEGKKQEEIKPEEGKKEKKKIKKKVEKKQ